MLKPPETATLQGFYLFARSKPRDETYAWSNRWPCAWRQYMDTLAEPVPVQAWIHPPYVQIYSLAAAHWPEDPYAIPFGALADRLEAAMVSAQ